MDEDRPATNVDARLRASRNIGAVALLLAFLPLLLWSAFVLPAVPEFALVFDILAAFILAGGGIGLAIASERTGSSLSRRRTALFVNLGALVAAAISAGAVLLG